MTPHDKRQLEALIDTYRLVGVIDALVEICHEKAEHIATNWQDKPLAKDWTRSGNAIDRANERLKKHFAR